MKILAFILGVFLFSSCTSTLYTSLDVLRPAKVAFEPDAKNLLIVNNSIIQPANYGHINLLLNEKPKLISVATDSLAIFCLSALKEGIEEKNFFSSVQLLTNSTNNSTDFIAINQLNKDSVNSLCKQYQTDAILALNKIKVNDELNEYSLDDYNSYLSTFEIKLDTYWSIYYPTKNEISTIQFKDTVYWENEAYSRKKATSELPKRHDALIDGALIAGQKSVNRFTPYWDKVDRYFFNPKNKIMKQGIDSIYVKNWNAAIKCWENLIGKTKSYSLKAKASNNIAIAYEILGDIEKAFKAATNSLEYYSRLSIISDYKSIIQISEYHTELSKRKYEIDFLKLQLGEKK